MVGVLAVAVNIEEGRGKTREIGKEMALGKDLFGVAHFAIFAHGPRIISDH